MLLKSDLVGHGFSVLLIGLAFWHSITLSHGIIISNKSSSEQSMVAHCHGFSSQFHHLYHPQQC